MRRALVSALVLSAAAAVILALGAPNFSGTWVLDTEKSDPMGGGMGGGMRGGGGGGGPVQVTLVIVHEGDSLQISRKMIMGGQERVQDLKYTTDGAENSNPGMGNQAVVSKTTWKGQELVTQSTQTRNTQQGEMTFHVAEVRSLSEDGNVLTVVTTTSTPMGERTQKQVFNKQ